MKIKGKIGYINNKNLPKMSKLKGGHYVYINSLNNDGTCNVNVVTSLEKKEKEFTYNKINHLRNGVTYCIPKHDGNFTKWSGINLNTIKNVKLTDIKNIGCKEIKQRHKFFIGKYSK